MLKLPLDMCGNKVLSSMLDAGIVPLALKLVRPVTSYHRARFFNWNVLDIRGEINYHPFTVPF